MLLVPIFPSRGVQSNTRPPLKNRPVDPTVTYRIASRGVTERRCKTLGMNVKTRAGDESFACKYGEARLFKRPNSQLTSAASDLAWVGPDTMSV